MAHAGGELWLQWFACCAGAGAARGAARGARGAARRIDRSMISGPTNFQHTGHIGSHDMEMPTELLHSLQHQMQGKGGYQQHRRPPPVKVF